jgi:hypothetical protein
MWKKTKVIGISRQPSLSNNYNRPKTAGECGMFEIFG